MNRRGFVYTIQRHSKEYVGATALDSPVLRWHQHLQAAGSGSTYPIHCALRKYGGESFQFNVIWEGPVEQLGEQEIRFIQERNTQAPFGYNLRVGGEGLLLTEEARKRVTLAYDRRAAGVLFIFPDLEFSEYVSKVRRRAKGGTFSTGKVCILSENEKTHLMHWGALPHCGHHRHLKKAAVLTGPYQFLQCRDGLRLPMAVPLLTVSGWIDKYTMQRLPSNVFANSGRQRV